MKMRKVLFAITLMALFAFSVGTVSNVSAQESTDACDSPAEFIEITADPNVSGVFEYDKNELTVSKNTCVQVKFFNLSPAIEHDFTIDADSESGFAGVHLHMLNNEAGVDGGNYKTVNFMTPDVDVTLEFYCSVTGHRDAGMYGDFVIGDGTAAPGFGMTTALLALFGLLAIPMLKKRN